MGLLYGCKILLSQDSNNDDLLASPNEIRVLPLTRAGTAYAYVQWCPLNVELDDAGFVYR